MQNIIFKILYIILIFLFCSHSAEVSAQDNFEGRVKIKITSNSESNIIDYYKKDDAVRIEVMAEQKAIMIFKSDKTLMMMPANKMYMEFEGSLMDMMNMLNTGKQTEEKIKEKWDEIESYKTGETKTIHGLACEKYYKTDDNEETEVWITHELGKFIFMQNPMNGKSSWMSDFSNKGFFPMVIKSKNKKLGITNNFEVEEIEKKSLDNSLFEAPSDYKKMMMPNMMKKE